MLGNGDAVAVASALDGDFRNSRASSRAMLDPSLQQSAKQIFRRSSAGSHRYSRFRRGYGRKSLEDYDLPRAPCCLVAYWLTPMML